jgi:universal stress protein E
MNRLKNILLGSDFSPCSASALQQATRITKWHGARLHAVHVVNATFVREYAEALERPLMLLESEILEAMRIEMNQWLAKTEGAIEGEVLIGMPLDVLLRKTKELNADLLILGLHGEQGEHTGAGQLATKCLRKAATKVMLVHKDHGGPFKNVIACVDFSEASREAVEQALRVGEQDQSHVHFVHVFTSPWRQLHLHMEDSGSSPDWEQKYLEAQQARLKLFVGDTRGVHVSFSMVVSGSVLEGISACVRDLHADLLVMGGRGQSNLSYVLLGSTVERLLNELSCSVLVARKMSEGARDPVPWAPY